MKKIISIAAMTFRSAVRSKIIGVLAALVSLSIIGLPFIIKGDGTPAGTVQLYLHYAFGLATAMISIAALWSGAAAFSLEVENHQIQMLTTKPVRSLHLWTGKWVGLMMMNAILIAIAGILTYGMLISSIRASIFSDAERKALREEILVARTGIFPDLLTDQGESIIHEGRIGVPAGGRILWKVRLPHKTGKNESLLIQYNFATSRIFDTASFKALWTVETEEELFSIESAAAPNLSHTFKIPAAIAKPGSEMIITYTNIESDRPAYIIFPAADGVQVLIRHGGFEMNYLRAMLLIFARMSFFSALGLALGAFFSFPVAVFTAFGFLFMTVFNRFIETMATVGLRGSQELREMQALLPWDPIIKGLFTLLNLIIPPFWRFAPFAALETGDLLSWNMTAHAFFTLVLIYPGALALLSCGLFSRRELGLP